MQHQLKSTDDVIAALGGLTAVGRLTGHHIKAVYHWRRRGFPPATYVILKAALAAKDSDAPDSLWQMLEAAE